MNVSLNEISDGSLPAAPEKTATLARLKTADATEVAAAAATGEDLPKSVVFQIEKEFYAFPVENVLEISYPLPTTRLPLTPAWLLGIVNLRGDIVPVVDFLRFIGRSPQKSAATKTKMIVLISRRDETKVGLIVDQVREVQHVSTEFLLAPAASLEPHLAYFLRGTAAHKTHAVNVLDAEKFFSSPYMRTLT